MFKRIVFSFLPCIVAFAIATTCGEPAKSGDIIDCVWPERKKESKINKVSPPQAGVRLLEHIFLRLHNLPQLAMKRAKQTLAFQNQAAAQIAQGPTDPLLAIKPKETPKKGETKPQFTDSSPRTIALLPPSVFSKVLKEVQQERAATENREERKDLLRRNFIPTNEQDRVLKDSEGIGNQLRKAGSVPSVVDSRAFSNDGNRGIQASTSNSYYRAAPGAKRTSSSSGIALNKGTGQLEELQSLAGGNAHSSRVGSGKEAVRRSSGAGDSSEDGRYTDYTRGQRLSDRPRITEFPSESPASQAKKERSRPSALTNSSNTGALLGAKQSVPTPMAPPEAPPLYKIVREFLNSPKNTNALKDKSDLLVAQTNEQLSYGDEVYDGISGDASRLRQQHYSSVGNRFAEVALLPPSVISGIPLMRLGVSENEATKILAARGSVSKHLIGEWTVWSLLKPHSNETMLQVYLRHGIVEAIRIFDGAFVSPQLGIRFGDTLSAVKQRFGEPRFILSEPLSRANYGQNYVYPISQVCFQLARIRTDSTPQVVSLLIFNVK